MGAITHGLFEQPGSFSRPQLHLQFTSLLIFGLDGRRQRHDCQDGGVTTDFQKVHGAAMVPLQNSIGGICFGGTFTHYSCLSNVCQKLVSECL